MMTHYDVEFKLSNCQIIPHPPPPHNQKKGIYVKWPFYP